jgi:hypothetical protein
LVCCRDRRWPGMSQRPARSWWADIIPSAPTTLTIRVHLRPRLNWSRISLILLRLLRTCVSPRCYCYLTLSFRFLSFYLIFAGASVISYDPSAVFVQDEL